MKKIQFFLCISLSVISCGKDTQPEAEPKPTMTQIDINDGAIEAPFSIGDGKVIYFSQGNLQYNASSNSWRFAEEQYNILGEDNKKISASYNGWIDLFGWATSGYRNHFPFSTSSESDAKDDISGTQYDWGRNAIINGGNKQGVWRTLTRSEWDYLLSRNVRSASGFNKYHSRYRVKIHGVFGLLILPDNWIWGANGVGDSPSCQQEISDERWQKMQKYGAVFLPEGGSILQSPVKNEIIYYSFLSGYWTSSPYVTSYVDVGKVYFVEWGVCTERKISDYGLRKEGYSVRLVKDVQ